jgi:hypothetical protein
MILDQVFFGVLNEKAGTLEVFDEPQEEVSVMERQVTKSLQELLSGALETMKQMGSVIQALYEKVCGIILIDVQRVGLNN